ncbi:phosphoglycerate mutase-like protein [Xylaria nigripes]|nr:phosphoglycerate mutase-like protein [Xylaria nigripes]
MAPIIHLVRHAQGYHNLDVANQWIRDPKLTELGIKQCKELCENFPYHNKITHLAASPLLRTLYTCQLSFAPAVKAGKKIVALPDAQEISLYHCDLGSEVGELKQKFGNLVDFQLIPKDWPNKGPGSRHYPDISKLDARARDTRLWLRDLVKEAGDDAHVVLVTHGGILHFITEEWSGISPDRGTAWFNTEYRSYEFVDKTGQDPAASLVELPESRRRRNASETLATVAENKAMRAGYEAVLALDLETATRELAKNDAL